MVLDVVINVLEDKKIDHIWILLSVTLELVENIGS